MKQMQLVSMQYSHYGIQLMYRACQDIKYQYPVQCARMVWGRLLKFYEVCLCIRSHLQHSIEHPMCRHKDVPYKVAVEKWYHLRLSHQSSNTTIQYYLLVQMAAMY